MSQIFSVLISAVASFIGAWLAALFALSRFYRERSWERKAAAYTTIFEALHQMQYRYDIEYHAEITGQKLTDEERTKLWTEYRSVKDDMYKTLAGQTWVISEDSQILLSELDLTLSKSRESMFEIYEYGLAAVTETTAQLKKLAKADLELSATSPLRRILRFGR